MSVSRFTDDASAPGVPQRKRLTLPALIAIILACCAVVAGALWGPLVMNVANGLRPVTARPGAIPPQTDIDAARQHMWTIVILSFIALAVLATIALYVGRWAFSPTAAKRLRRETWALWCLIGGLLLGVAVPLLLSSAGIQLPYLGILSLSLPLASAVASFFLSGIALPSAADSVRLPDQVRPTGPVNPRFSLVASIIVACLAAAVIALAAQFTVGFFMHIVW